MTEENASILEQALRIRSCWTFGNPYSLRFLDDPPADPPVDPPPTPTSFVGTDGKLIDNWQSHAPKGYEDLIEDKSLSTIKSVWDMGKSYVHIRKQVPLDKTALPNDKWGDADWSEWHKAGGRPDTAADYGIQRHEEIPEEAMSKEVIEGYQELFHKIGLSKKQVDAITAHNSEMMLKQMKTMEQNETISRNKMMDSLSKQFGQATEQRTRWSTGAIGRGVKDINGTENLELREFITNEINQPGKIGPWAAFLSNIESNFSEHDIAEGFVVATPGDLKSQIKDLTDNPKIHHNDPEVREPLIQERNRLLKKLSESK